jgi:hypothetical protein
MATLQQRHDQVHQHPQLHSCQANEMQREHVAIKIIYICRRTPEIVQSPSCFSSRHCRIDSYYDPSLGSFPKDTFLLLL